MLRPGGDYSAALLRFISDKTGCTDVERIRTVLDAQKVIWSGMFVSIGVCCGVDRLFHRACVPKYARQQLLCVLRRSLLVKQAPFLARIESILRQRKLEKTKYEQVRNLSSINQNRVFACLYTRGEKDERDYRTFRLPFQTMHDARGHLDTNSTKGNKKKDDVCVRVWLLTYMPAI
jgi:hypothetical protein